jgi:FAD/FMN-containing dehydrogenase
VSRVSGQVTAGAGIRLAVLTAHARAAGLDFGVDLAARDSATLGGMLATNAGGIRVLRYGSMREQVAGVEAALIDGRVISRLDAPAKDSTGYDIGHLLAGSEGTLAVVTRLRLRLVPADQSRAVALIAVRGTGEAVDLLAELRSELPGLCAAEICFRPGLTLTAGYLGVPVPLADAGGEAWVLVENAADADPLDDLLTALEKAGQVLDATVASSPADRARLWQLRESHAEAISTAGQPVKLDVSVPSDRLAELVARLPDAVVAAAGPAARLVIFGHLAEANLHVNVMGAAEKSEEAADAVLTLVASLGGSISSEHGVGRAKARWLELSRSPAEIAVMRSVKAAFDPRGLLNPGVLLEASPAGASL